MRSLVQETISFFSLCALVLGCLLPFLTVPFLVYADTVNLIAYVGNDRNIYVMKPDGTNRQNLTQTDPVQTALLIQFPASRNRRLFNWPTWSPSGTRPSYE